MGAGGRIRRIKAVGGREGEEGWIEGGKGGTVGILKHSP